MDPSPEPRPSTDADVRARSPVRVQVLPTPARSESPPPTQREPDAERAVRTGEARLIEAVVPCFNRQRDLDLLMADLLRLEVPTGARLRVTVVDNASEPPLTLHADPTVDARLVRNSENSGGSGGFNTGLALAIADPARGPEERPELLWLLDSDARVEPRTLVELVRAMDGYSGLVAVGSAVADPETGEVFELGATLRASDGRMVPLTVPIDMPDKPVRCEYVPACSMLVRRDAVERTGLLPDVFLNGDDSAWCLHLARTTGGRVAAVGKSVVRHPRFDGFKTWQRYYETRNAFVPIAAGRLGPLTRFRRALRETGRAMTQALVQRPDLARLHMAALGDAAAGRTTGPAGLGTPHTDAMRPLRDLDQTLKAIAPRGRDTVAFWPEGDLPPETIAELKRAVRQKGLKVQDTTGRRSKPLWMQVLSAGWRLVLGPRHELAFVSAKGRPNTWFRGRETFQIADGAFFTNSTRRWAMTALALRLGMRGVQHAARLALRPPPPVGCRPALEHLPPTVHSEPLRAQRCTLSIIVLSYNRKDHLLRTIRELRGGSASSFAPIVVVDNASTDGSVAALREHHPDVTVVELHTNIGVAGFNRGVDLATGEYVLILDDDAWTDPGDLDAAVRLLDERMDLAAVSFHRRHPRTKQSEWPGEKALKEPARDDWPEMGCGNLVRRSVWHEVGGYEEGYFLYRNDVDLALKLRGRGLGVHYNPHWTVWHDSPVVATKSLRWLEFSTRNWIWLCRRHGRGFSAWRGAVMGWLWAHKWAGLSPKKQWVTLRGARAGFFGKPPSMDRVGKPDGTALKHLLKLKTHFRGK